MTPDTDILPHEALTIEAWKKSATHVSWWREVLSTSQGRMLAAVLKAACPRATANGGEFGHGMIGGHQAVEKLLLEDLVVAHKPAVNLGITSY